MTVAQRLESLSANAGLRKLVARISAGGWFEFYDLFMVAYIALGLIGSSLYSALGTGLASLAGFAGSGFAGMFVGTLLFGWVSDRFGRKTTFTWSLVFYSIMTAAMALARSAPAIDALRFVACIGIGVQIVTIDAYIAEIAPKDARGRLIAFSQAICYTAVPVVAFIASLLVPHSIAGLDGWRWVALIGALGALLAWPIQAGLPESPRWLQSRGRTSEAHAALERIEQEVDPQKPAAPIEIEPLPPKGNLLASLARIWRRDYRSRTIMLSLFNIFQTIGFYGFAAWIPVILRQSGHPVALSLHYASIIAIVTPLGPLLAMRFADSVERKIQIVVLACASAAFAFALAYLGAPWAILTFGSLITLVNTWFSCSFHAYQSELYPTSVRAGAVGFVYGWSRLSAIFVGYLYAFMLRAHGAGAAFETMAVAMVISATIVALFGALTNRKQLEVLAP
ncbi:MAG: MFS transporter [Candidatus Eremiobacteraeota bacterium]|nr:MFS transporter [Candidatus Eremiobacteraeota bacterium]